MENHKEGVEVQETKLFKMAIRFADGEKEGKPHDRVLGFAVDAKTEQEARRILKDWLLKCVEKLENA